MFPFARLIKWQIESVSDSPEPAPLMVVGSVAFDNVITPYGTKEGILGGAASYCSFAASYFTQPRMVGVIGNDFGEEYLDRLRKRGIDLRRCTER